ncbi:MAG: hypothetical protein ACYS8W_07510 [Planctomycetota bacterium]
MTEHKPLYTLVQDELEPIYACYGKTGNIVALSRDKGLFDELDLIQSERETNIKCIDSLTHILEIITPKKQCEIIIDVDTIPGGQFLPQMLNLLCGPIRFVLYTSREWMNSLRMCFS